MYLIFSPHHEFTPIRVDGGEDMQSGSLALTIASAIADALGEAIIHNGISHRTHRLLRADESTDATAELLADDEAMARIAEGERELAERYLQTGGREPTAEERAADRQALLNRAKQRAEEGEFIEYTEDDLRELRGEGEAAA